ncbi:hypothetical protein LTR56_028245, partial [Elasticomyces elasticus]
MADHRVSHFGRLSVELRLRIYESTGMVDSPIKIQANGDVSTVPIFAALARTNRQMYSEVLDYFFNNGDFVFSAGIFLGERYFGLKPSRGSSNFLKNKFDLLIQVPRGTAWPFEAMLKSLRKAYLPKVLLRFDNILCFRQHP